MSELSVPQRLTLPGYQDGGRTYAPPRYQLASAYVEDGQVRRRDTSLDRELHAEFERLMDRVAWSRSADRTVREYRQYIAQYWHFCAANHLERYDLRSLAHYVYLLAYPRLLYLHAIANGEQKRARGHQPGIGKASVKVVVAAITKDYAWHGLPRPSAHPEWREWFRGLLARLRQEEDLKDPWVREDLVAAIAMAQDERSPLIAARNVALLLLGWCCALRRSTLAAVEVPHLVDGADGTGLLVPRSKTDQEGRGRVIPIYPARDPSYDPMLAVRRWLALAGISKGAVFRRVLNDGRVGELAMTPHAIYLMMKRYRITPNIGAHSLRAGFVTQGQLDGRPKHQLRVVTTHASDRSLERYYRVRDPFEQGPGSLL